MQEGLGTESVASEIHSLISRGFEEIGADISQDAQDHLVQLILLLDRWAERMNLTGHRDPLAMTSRLVLDAAALASALPELASASSLTDLGSGAGFPGLPLAILHPEIEVRLVEARQKRHHFQREARRRLGLDRVTPLLGRSDQLEPEPSQIVIAQAMTQPDEALRLMLAWGQPGGIIALPASGDARRPAAPPMIDDLAKREYIVPGQGTVRTLWVGHVRES